MVSNENVLFTQSVYLRIYPGSNRKLTLTGQNLLYLLSVSQKILTVLHPVRITGQGKHFGMMNQAINHR